MFKRTVLKFTLYRILPLVAITALAGCLAVEPTPGLAFTQTTGGGPGIMSITTNLDDYPNGVVPRYQKFEITFTLDTSYPNPFNPEEVRVDANFISPGGSTVVQPGFYYQEYVMSIVNGSEIYTTTGSPVWKVRFAPGEIGTYQYSLQVTDKNGTTISALDTFDVSESGDPGFIRVSGSNPRYFAFDSGKPFFGFGLNIAWWQHEDQRISTYTYYLDRMETYQANLARVWMTNSGVKHNWILSIQDKTLGGDYNLEEAWAFDRILDMAHDKGVYFLLTLDDFNQYTYNWPDNLYNSQLGGPCTYRSAIFTEPEAKKYQKRIFRYIVARWGYSPTILSWELFNEIDELQWSDPLHWDRQAMIDWHKEMAGYLASIDAHQHLVNTSTGSFKTHPDLYGLPEMALAQIHFYYVPGCCSYAPSDPAGRDMADLTRYYAHLLYGSVTGKPGLIGEWGILNNNWTPSPHLDNETQGIHLHNGLWSSLMSGMAATSLNWHWGYHKVHDPAWWEHYSALAAFFEPVRLENLAVMKPLNVDFSLPNGGDNRPDVFSSSNNKLRVMGLRSGNWVHGWVQNTENTWWNTINGVTPQPQSGTITVDGFTPGKNYVLEQWGTYAGSQGVLTTNTVTALVDGSIIVHINNLDRDVAFKIHPALLNQVWIPTIIK